MVQLLAILLVTIGSCKLIGLENLHFDNDIGHGLKQEIQKLNNQIADYNFSSTKINLSRLYNDRGSYYKEIVSPFLEIKTIRVLTHIISSSIDTRSIEEVLISSFEKYGTVLSSNNKLTKKDEIKKNDGNVFLIIDIKNIKDANSQNYLPVLHISVHLFEEARLLENNKEFICETWKMDEFLQEFDRQEDTNAKVIEILQSILDKFKIEYLRANPQEKPVFFLGKAISSENIFSQSE